MGVAKQGWPRLILSHSIMWVCPKDGQWLWDSQSGLSLSQAKSRVYNSHWHVLTWIWQTYLAWYQQAVNTGIEMGAGIG